MESFVVGSVTCATIDLKKRKKMMINFFVSGAPRGKERPRFSNGHTYTPRKTLEYETKIKASYVMGGFGKSDRILKIDILAVFKIPQSYSKKRKKEIIERGLRPDKKPDADNIAKVVMDALNGVAYNDDKQVVDLRVAKVYSEDREGLDITIGEADEMETV